MPGWLIAVLNTVSNESKSYILHHSSQRCMFHSSRNA